MRKSLESQGITPSCFLTAILIYALVLTVSHYRGLDFLPDGPYRRTAEVSRSIWNDLSLSPPEFEEIRIRAVDHSLRTQRQYIQDVFALGKNGELYPKHSLFSCLVAAPFYGVFGDAGFQVAHGLLFLLLLISMSCTLHRITGNDVSIILLITATLGSQLLFELFRYSYDLHGAALILFGIALRKRFPVCSGLTVTLSYFVRPSNLLFLPFLYFFVMLHDRKTRWLIRFSIGAGVGSLLILSVNYFLFGSPLATAYHRLPVINGEQLVLADHPIGFSLTALTSNWWSKLFDASHGLLPYNPGYLLAPISLWALLHPTTGKYELRIIVFAAFCYSLYVFSYPIWQASHFGNRFMFPATCIFLLPLVVGINALKVKYAQRS